MSDPPAPKRHPLHQAVWNHEILKMRELVKGGADVNECDGEGNTPLHYAGNAELARVLLEAGAQVGVRNSTGDTPLHYAASARFVRAMVDAGADANALNNEGDPPLYTLVTWCHPVVVRALLNGGADKDFKNSVNTTILHVAVLNGFDSTVGELLEAGADPNVRGVEGRTPLHEAVREDHLEKIRLLLETGADAQIWNDQGETPERLPQCTESAMHEFKKHESSKKRRKLAHSTPDIRYLAYNDEDRMSRGRIFRTRQAAMKWVRGQVKEDDTVKGSDAELLEYFGFEIDEIDYVDS